MGEVSPPPIKVLYLHGLEEKESSPKPRTLAMADDIDLCMPDLQVYFNRRNGPLVGEHSCSRLLQLWCVGTLFLDNCISCITIGLLMCPWFQFVSGLHTSAPAPHWQLT